MVKCGCSEKFIHIERQFHDGMQARVQVNGILTEPFSAPSGVKQGCVLVQHYRALSYRLC